jgi:hypothetical protein
LRGYLPLRQCRTHPPPAPRGFTAPVAAGPIERKRESVAIATDGGLKIVDDLAAQYSSSNLHAKTRAVAVDDDVRARLLRYVLPPTAC